MSTHLHELARKFAIGEIAAEDFANPFMEVWKQERDSADRVMDSEELSECLSSIFCLADRYNPNEAREEYELKESGLRVEVRKVLDELSSQAPH